MMVRAENGMMKKKLLIAAAGLAALIAAAGLLLFSGIIQINHPSGAQYPVRGVDVSHYQGEIDWPTLSGEGIRFAYIKATEGSSSQDGQFRENWTNAAQTGLRIGAYHFFSFETDGRAQAENFISVVGIVPGMLPPAVDVEGYGAYQSNRLPSGALDELAAWVDAVEAWCRMKPVIYTTFDYYDQIHAALPDCDIWIRSVYGAPPKGVSWTIWQYSNRNRLKGYSGPERFIDMNVFAGTEAEFDQYGK